MNKILLAFCCAIAFTNSFSQTNTFPSSGNVGIGTTNPGTKFSVAYSNSSTAISSVTDYVRFQNTNTTSGALNSLLFINSGGFASAAISVSQTQIGNNGDNFILQSKANTGTWNASQLVLNVNGNVGVGIITPNEKLAVNGNIRAKEIKVESANWPDYVFTKTYELLSLQETEKQVQETGHLPGIPSATEVKTNGIALGEMNAKLLQKIEELTLYLIEQNKQLADQQIINQSDKSQLQLQQKQIDQLSRQLSIISNKPNLK